MYHVTKLLLKDEKKEIKSKKNKTPGLQHDSEAQPVRSSSKAWAQQNRKHNSDANWLPDGGTKQNKNKTCLTSVQK